LNKVLVSAVKKELIRKNWAAEVERPSVTPKEAAHLEPGQVVALLKAAEKSRYSPLFQLLALTGLRSGEALALKWEDVRPKGKDIIYSHSTLSRIDGKLTVTEPKTKNSKRELFISDDLDAVLKTVKQRQRKEQLKAGSLWEKTGFVFTTEVGQPCDPRNALRALYAAVRKAKLPKSCLHTLRHSAATMMLDAGVPILTVSRQLGHYSVSITGDIYGHVSEEASAEAMKALAKAVNG
jgi:integrase